jgi:hypothetical protein
MSIGSHCFSGRIDSMTKTREKELAVLLTQMADNHIQLRNEVAALMAVLAAKEPVTPASLAAAFDSAQALSKQDRELDILRSFQGPPQ